MEREQQTWKRDYLAGLIAERLRTEQESLRQAFHAPGRIHSCYLDDLLPAHIVTAIYEAFPPAEEMVLLKSIREHKRIAAQMNQYHPLLEEVIFAFQDKRVVDICTRITGLDQMEPDALLYAGGISLMSQGDFLNPHLDNSHDKDRERYRVLNLLYYVSPDWQEAYGGNLELWDQGVQGTPRTVVSRCNRLALMITNKSSFHSVSKVVAGVKRCCISNYYFSRLPAAPKSYFHVTSFYGRPEESLKSIELSLDRGLRNLIGKMTRKRLIAPKHVYKKPQEP